MDDFLQPGFFPPFSTPNFLPILIKSRHITRAEGRKTSMESSPADVSWKVVPEGGKESKHMVEGPLVPLGAKAVQAEHLPRAPRQAGQVHLDRKGHSPAPGSSCTTGGSTASKKERGGGPGGLQPRAGWEQGKHSLHPWTPAAAAADTTTTPPRRSTWRQSHWRQLWGG